MQVLYERCAGIDVHKDQVTVAVRAPGSGPGARDTRVRKFGAFYGVLREMTRWLVSQGVTHVAMEATGIYTMPVCHALLEPAVFERVLVCNAAHVKNVPGRKTDAVDASWLAELLECGLLRGSFIPPEDIKAVRDVVRYRFLCRNRHKNRYADAWIMPMPDRVAWGLTVAGVKTSA